MGWEGLVLTRETGARNSLAAHQLISSIMVEEVPLAGLSFRGPLGVSPVPLLGTFATDIVSSAHCVSSALSPSGLRLLPQPRSGAPGSPLARKV